MCKNLIIAFLLGVVVVQHVYADDFSYKASIKVIINHLAKIEQQLIELNHKIR